jgi:hypothetical protein
VLFDVDSTNDLFLVEIRGTLIFEPRSTVTELRAVGVVVMPSGSLIIGTECCPYNQRARIVLLDDPFEFTKTKNIGGHGVGHKCLAVLTGGSLEMYGEFEGRTWTEVSTTHAIGATTITLRDPVSWKAGDEVVIAGTDFNT